MTDPQYAAASAVVTRALEVKRTFEGTKLPAFVYRGVPVTNHVLIAEALCLRGTICRRLGDYEESKLMTESALNIYKDLFGRKSLSVSGALYEYADYHVDVGVLSEALSLHVVSLDIRRQFLSTNTAGSATSADTLKKERGV